MYLEAGMQSALDAGVNAFGAQLFAESLEKKAPEIQTAGVTLVVKDHLGKCWYVTATTTEPEFIEVNPIRPGDPDERAEGR